MVKTYWVGHCVIGKEREEKRNASATTKETVNTLRLADDREHDVGHNLEDGDAWKKRTR